jgi:hypothetical protein
LEKGVLLIPNEPKESFFKTNQSHHLIARAYQTTIAKLAWGFWATL